MKQLSRISSISFLVVLIFSSIVYGASVPASLLSSGNLTVGSKGAAVMDLQKFLNGNGYPVSASGAGSPGNESSYFGSATKAALAKWQAAAGISPASGFFGPISRAKLASTGSTTTTTTTTIETINPNPVTTTATVATTSPNIPVATTTVPAVPTPFVVNSLRIETIYPSVTLSRYTAVVLDEFRVTAQDKVAITRLRFKNSGTLADATFGSLQLVNSANGQVLATAADPVNQYFEFKLKPDPSKLNQGLVVSGGTYNILADLRTPNTTVIPTIRLDLASSSDISAFDFNDLNRVADISQSNVFPVQGPLISTF